MTEANAEQRAYWNEKAGPQWVANQARLDPQIRPWGEAVMDALALRPGERVIDVGCGCGDTTLEIARRVGATGRVLGADVSGPMLALARSRAAADGLEHVHFEQADAQTYAFAPGGADVVFSRFGVMFFSDPTAAFANLHAALAPGGRVGFVCWQPLPVNEWVTVPLAVIARHVPLPDPPEPGAPGPFSLGDPGRIRAVLEGAGFSGVGVHAFERRVAWGRDLDDSIDFFLTTGPAAGALREADADDALRARVADELRTALQPFLTPEGTVSIGAATWRVEARRD